MGSDEVGRHDWHCMKSTNRPSAGPLNDTSFWHQHHQDALLWRVDEHTLILVAEFFGLGVLD